MLHRVLKSSNFDITKADPEFQEFLKPIQSYLAETEGGLDLEGFCVTMDYVLEKSGMPASHLLAQRSRRRR
jgi:hypothetical protein